MCSNFGFTRHCYVVFDCFDHDVPCYLIRTRNTFHGCKNWFGMLNALRHSLLKLLEAYGSTAVMTVLKSALELRKN